MLQKLGKELGEEKVHPHKFRRTPATKTRDNEMPMEQV
jgi:integrase/recombinase XerD